MQSFAAQSSSAHFARGNGLFPCLPARAAISHCISKQNSTATSAVRTPMQHNLSSCSRTFAEVRAWFCDRSIASHAPRSRRFRPTSSRPEEMTKIRKFLTGEGPEMRIVGIRLAQAIHLSAPSSATIRPRPALLDTIRKRWL
jgi:hypothetical protein